MGPKPAPTIKRSADPRRGQTWQEVWARHIRPQDPAATRVTDGHVAKTPPLEGAAPVKRAPATERQP
jgi:hypothetical protein